jgi:ubiquinone/menaquinone biosynthesis C-methylase UbiE
MKNDLDQYEAAQKARFDKEAIPYHQHFYDKYSKIYRTKFINDTMCDRMNISESHVLEAMCGSGEMTEYLDISSEMIILFNRFFPNCNAVCSSILENDFKNNSFDYVFIVGGLHHIHPNVDKAIDEIYRILKPGGFFCFTEPHTGSFPDLIREIWYKMDDHFENNEAAIDIDSLESKNSRRFEYIRKKYMGNVGYLFVLNSMALRIPISLKKYYSNVLLLMESIITPIQCKKLSCYAICQWKKK